MDNSGSRTEKPAPVKGPVIFATGTIALQGTDEQRRRASERFMQWLREWLAPIVDGAKELHAVLSTGYSLLTGTYCQETVVTSSIVGQAADKLWRALEHCCKVRGAPNEQMYVVPVNYPPTVRTALYSLLELVPKVKAIGLGSTGLEPNLREMVARLEYAVRALSEELSGPVEPTPGTKLNPNDSRDCFCYEGLRAGRSLKWIRTEVNKRADWEGFETDQGVSAAAMRYAKREDLPWPLKRNRRDKSST
jgi:hypothetical protein